MRKMKCAGIYDSKKDKRMDNCTSLGLKCLQTEHQTFNSDGLRVDREQAFNV